MSYPLQLARGYQSPYLLLLSLVYLLLSPQMIDIFHLGIPSTVSPLPPHLILLHNHNYHTLLLPHYLDLFFFLALIATILMATYISPLVNIVIFDYHTFLLLHGYIFCFPRSYAIIILIIIVWYIVTVVIIIMVVL